jgi:DNA-binding IclR family transcriptional regulator
MFQSVKTALNIFEIVAKHEPIGVSEIARRCEVAESTKQSC